MDELTVTPSRHGPFPGRLDRELITAYMAATGDDTASVRSGSAVPAVLPVILVFAAQEAARADLPAAAWERVTGGVHGSHDILLHRPLQPDEPLETWATISAVRTARAGSQIVMAFEQFDAEGRLAVEQWWTMVLLGLRDMADLGEMPSAHRFPDDARDHPIGSVRHHIDDQVAHRYAEVSGDWAAHHFDIDVARAAGFDFVFTHGLCTMAICTHRVLQIAGIDDPGRVARVAVRFASPTPMGADLAVTAYEIDTHAYAFEATAGGATTITHGRLELRQ